MPKEKLLQMKSWKYSDNDVAVSEMLMWILSAEILPRGTSDSQHYFVKIEVAHDDDMEK